MPSRPELPSALVPHKATSHLNEEVPLGSFDLVLHLEDIHVDMKADAFLTWAPYARPLLKARATEVSLDIARALESPALAKAMIAFRGETVRCHVESVSRNYNVGGFASIECDICVPRWEHVSGPMHEVRFLVSNLSEFRGDWVLREGSMSSARLALSHDGFEVIVEGLENLADLRGQTKKSRGHAITHVGRIRREDGSTFESSKAHELLLILQHYFTLTQGNWVACILPEGLGERGDIVWEYWYAPRDGYWSSPSTWFYFLHTEGLGTLFSRMCDKWDHLPWQKAFQYGLFWYNLAITSTAPNAILVMTQNALERLSWHHFITAGDRSSRQFDKKSAHERIGLLLEANQIPTGIPEQLRTLSAYAASQGWEKGPQATARLRNLDCHPKGEEEPPNLAIGEASDLSIWYLELCLLAMSGYDGLYWNRIRAPELISVPIELVPWATGSHGEGPG